MTSPTSSTVHFPFLLRARRALWRCLPRLRKGSAHIPRASNHPRLFHSSSEDSILTHCIDYISCSNVFFLLSRMLQLHTATVRTQLSVFVQHALFADSPDKHPLHLINAPANNRASSAMVSFEKRMVTLRISVDALLIDSMAVASVHQEAPNYIIQKREEVIFTHSIPAALLPYLPAVQS